MILSELIKKLEELNNESENAVKPVKIRAMFMNNEWVADISEVSLVYDHIEIE